MKILDDVGLSYLIEKIKEMINTKANTDYVDRKIKSDVPNEAKFTGSVSSIEEPSLNIGDEWHKEL